MRTRNMLEGPPDVLPEDNPVGRFGKYGCRQFPVWPFYPGR
ncbi:hypothetical protein LptCag_1877 [Leptospirillum ferriphilum]|uniref:Uncharacterized protein n=1 Tax=Leptospirillum ferriphilum TaxID=178606 RepID=A0A094WBY8_9BACT|nr:hypothetical protein LptCag_1877 [Leptospirillum ferriphilum]